jgi:hypothetical protein
MCSPRKRSASNAARPSHRFLGKEVAQMEVGVGGTTDLELMARVVVVVVEGGKGIVVEKGG